MSASLLAIITAITGLIYSFVRIQREYIPSVYVDALLAITLIGATLLLVEMVEKFTIRTLEKSKKQAPSDLLRLTISAALLTICSILILKVVYEKDITALLATSAVLAVALGWGLQRPVGHLFSGLTLEVERPLEVGDFVRVNSQVGQVEALKWRAVYVRTRDNTLIIFPNSELTDNSIELFPSKQMCRYHLDVGIRNDIPPSRVLKAATEVVSDKIPFLENSRDSTAQVSGLDSTAGTINYRIYFFTREFFRVEDIKAVILERLWYALSRNGIDMAGVNLQEDDTKQARRVEQSTSFLRTIEAFRDLSPESLKPLAQQLIVIIYAAGETVKIQQKRRDSLFIVQAGRVSVPCRVDNKLLEHGSKEKATDSVAPCFDASHWERHVLQQVADNLTYYLGPVSPQLVQREARLTYDPYELHNRLADHIDDKEEREQFLKYGPDEHVQVLGAGDGLCSILGYEEKLGKPRVVALQETELLELTGDNVKALKAGGGSVGNALAAYIEQIQNQAVLRSRRAHIASVRMDASKSAEKIRSRSLRRYW